MIRLVNRYNRAMYASLVQDMHAERKRVFVDLLKWDVPHDHRGEFDEFDDEHAEYLILQDSASGEHVASLRLLRTDRPHILAHIFPYLCESGVPRGPQIREVTRLCISPRRRAAERAAARNLLIRSLVEYSLLSDIHTLTGVADMAWLAQILSAGWDCRPLGMPQLVCGSLVGALVIRISSDTLNAFTPSWRCEAPPMRAETFNRPIAA